MIDPKSYRHDLDTLRALAVGLVLVFHFNLIPGVAGGFLGVDVFFVISGYIITRKNLPNALNGQFSLAQFWVARVRRLAPALIVTLLLTLLAGWFYYLPSQLESLAKQALATQTYVANIFYWRTINYFGLQAKLVPLLHTWSLAVEEQFYLLYPLLLLLAHRLRLRRFFWVLAGVTLVSFVLCLWMVGPKPEASFYLAPTRIWEIGVGCLLACGEWTRRQSLKAGPSSSATWQFVICLLVVIGSAVFYSNGIVTPGWYSALPVLGTVGLIWFGANLSGAVHTAWHAGWLRYLGQISYPLYLVHWPINVFAKDMLYEAYTWELRLACALLSVLLAAAIHEWAEKPIAALKALTLRKTLVPYALATLALSGGCVAILAMQGFEHRFSPQALQALKGETDRPPSLAHCIPEPDRNPRGPYEDPRCLLGDAGVLPSVAVLGDSHAWTAAGAISAALKPAGVSARIIFRHACPPLMGVHMQDGGQDACFQHNATVYDWVIQNPSIRRVVLVSTWIQGHDSLTDNPLDEATPEGSQALFDRSLLQSVQALKRAGKQVYLIGPVPGARYRVPHALARNVQGGRPATQGLEYTLQEHRARHAYFTAAMKNTAGQLDGYFDPASVLCDKVSCLVQDKGIPYYWDTDHLTRSGARLIEPGILKLLAPTEP